MSTKGRGPVAPGHAPKHQPHGEEGACVLQCVFAALTTSRKGMAERKEFVGDLLKVMDGGVTSRPATDTPNEKRPKPQRRGNTDDARSFVDLVTVI